MKDEARTATPDEKPPIKPRSHAVIQTDWILLRISTAWAYAHI
jgi:hypothetical protein